MEQPSENFKGKWFLGLLIVLCGWSCASIKSPQADALPIRISHPSLGTNEVAQSLYLVRDTQGYLLEYYLDVPSVICGDGQCEIITVRLFWNPIGSYLRYTLPKGGELTKRGHKQFTAEDLQKLQQVLSNSDSTLKNIDAKSVVSPAESQTGDEVDGISGATLIADENAIVSGAVYTCYTLWHWANGGIQEIIRNQSASAMPTAQLLNDLNVGTEAQALFAIDQLAVRQVRDEQTVAVVLEKTRAGDVALVESGLEYFEQMGAAPYYSAIEQLFASGSSEMRVLYLTSLTATDLEITPEFIDGLSAYFPEMKSYLEVHLLIGLMTYADSVSAESIQNTVPLLENKSFLVGRKAYGFLKRQELTESQREKLEAFRTRNAARL